MPVSEPRAPAFGPMAAVCSALIGLGSSLVLSAGDALFLHRVGPQHLGTAFAVSSALLVVVLSAVGARADRGRRDLLLLRIAVVSAAVLAVAALLAQAAPRLAAIVVLVGGKQMAAALELSFWVLLAERFDARQLRRSLPTLIAAGGAGLAVGAGAVAVLAESIGVPALALAGALAFLAAGLAAQRIAAVGALRPLPRAKLSEGRGLFGIAGGAAAVKASPVASRLVVLIVLGGAAGPIIHYLLGVRAAAAFDDEASLAAFFGGFRAVVQIATVLAQAILASRLISRLGIGRVMIAAPIVTLVAAIALLIRPELVAVVVAQALVKLVDGAIETPAQKLVQNLTRRELRGRVSGFLDGVAKRAGAIVGGLLAAVLAPGPVTFAAALIALAWLAAAFVFRARFPALAVQELSARATEGPSVGDDIELDRGGLAVLRAALRQGGAAGERARALFAEWGGHGFDYPNELAAALAECSSDVRPILARELSERLDWGAAGQVSAVHIAALAHADAIELRVIAARLGAEVSLSLAAPSADLAAATSLAAARLAGPMALEMFDDGDIFDRELCRAIGEDALDPSEESLATRRLVRLGRGRGTHAAQRAALIALRSLAERRGARTDGAPGELAEWMLMSASLADLGGELTAGEGPPTIRAAALEMWAAAGGLGVALEVANYLGDGDREIARAAALSLRRFGAGAIEALLRVAVFGRRRCREPALDLLGELRVPPEVLDGLIEREAEITSSAALHLAALSRIEGGALLWRRVEERLAESAHTLFLLLEARLASPSIGLAARRLRHARHRAARARAIEALDATLPRRFAPLLATLDGTEPSVRASAAASFSGRPVPRRETVLRAELAGDDRLAQRIAIYTLGDAGRSQYAGDITRAAEGAYSDADPDEVAARLVSLLGSGDNADETAKESGDGEMSRSIESVMVLSELALFSELSTRELAELAEVVSWVNASPGEVLMVQGEVGDAMYFVVGGEVIVERQSLGGGSGGVGGGDDGGEEVVATLGRGEPFGEMALFDDEVRSATVTASTSARLGRIERMAFEEIAREVPGIVLGICRVLSRRVRLDLIE